MGTVFFICAEKFWEKLKIQRKVMFIYQRGDKKKDNRKLKTHRKTMFI